MFPVFLAGAAVLEIRRALHRPPGDPDVEAMRKREAELKAALEVPASSAQHKALHWRSSAASHADCLLSTVFVTSARIARVHKR